MLRYHVKSLAVDDLTIQDYLNKESKCGWVLLAYNEESNSGEYDFARIITGKYDKND